MQYSNRFIIVKRNTYLGIMGGRGFWHFYNLLSLM